MELTKHHPQEVRENRLCSALRLGQDQETLLKQALCEEWMLENVYYRTLEFRALRASRGWERI